MPLKLMAVLLLAFFLFNLLFIPIVQGNVMVSSRAPNKGILSTFSSTESPRAIRGGRVSPSININKLTVLHTISEKYKGIERDVVDTPISSSGEYYPKGIIGGFVGLIVGLILWMPAIIFSFIVSGFFLMGGIGFFLLGIIAFFFSLLPLTVVSFLCSLILTFMSVLLITVGIIFPVMVMLIGLL